MEADETTSTGAAARGRGTGVSPSADMAGAVRGGGGGGGGRGGVQELRTALSLGTGSVHIASIGGVAPGGIAPITTHAISRWAQFESGGQRLEPISYM